MQHNKPIAQLVIDIFSSITSIESEKDLPVNVNEQYTFDPVILDISDESYETDKPIIDEPLEGSENIIILGEYQRMSSPGKIILFQERIKRRTVRLLRDYGSIVKRNLSYAEILKICEMSVLEVYIHERFHFATDLYSKLYNKFSKSLEEESFAVAFSYLFLINFQNFRSGSYSNDSTRILKRSLNAVMREQLFPFRNHLYHRRLNRRIGLNRKDELVFSQHIIDLLFNAKTLPFYKDWNKVVGDFSYKLLDYLESEPLKDLHAYNLNPEQILNQFLAGSITFDDVKLEIENSN